MRIVKTVTTSYKLELDGSDYFVDDSNIILNFLKVLYSKGISGHLDGKTVSDIKVTHYDDSNLGELT